MPDPVDIHRDTQADTRRRVALSMHDLHMFLFRTAYMNNSVIYQGVIFCFLEIVLSHMNTCPAVLLYTLSVFCVYLFINLPTFIVLEVGGDYKIGTNVLAFMLLFFPPKNIFHYFTIEAKSSNQNPDCWDTCINNDTTC